MEPYSIFKRMDRDNTNSITPVKVLNFLRENGVHEYSEAECFYLVKYFDSDEDGELNYADFMQIILPCDHSYLRAIATQRPNIEVSNTEYLDEEVEKNVAKLIIQEIKLHKQSERLKQELESALDFTENAVFSLIDDWSYGFIDTRNLRSFFRNQNVLISEKDCEPIIRRMSLEGDSKLTKEEFQVGIKPQEPYSKMLVRE